MTNSGIELTISADILRDGAFKWNTSFNITTTRNKVVSLANGLDNIIKGDASGLEITNITVPGKSIGQLYLTPSRSGNWVPCVLWREWRTCAV